ncbi:hypothetical protein H2136_20150 [Aeromonas hydrophila]|uniref:Uncharacterized protein n=1 Tax=Aeromonas hydrophila TaxID=644 RepID=A0A926IYB1_AERHY|nr:hypothetical protein [Aeromonas hydrophila]
MEDVKGVVTDPIRALSVYAGKPPLGRDARRAGHHRRLADQHQQRRNHRRCLVGTDHDTRPELNAALDNGKAFTALIDRATATAAASAIASADPVPPATLPLTRAVGTIGQSLTGDQVNNQISRPVTMDGVVGLIAPCC